MNDFQRRNAYSDISFLSLNIWRILFIPERHVFSIWCFMHEELFMRKIKFNDWFLPLFSGFSHCFEFFDEVFCQSRGRINHFAKVLLHGITFCTCEFILVKIFWILMHIYFSQVRSIWLWIMLCSTNLVFTFKVWSACIVVRFLDGSNFILQIIILSILIHVI